MKIAIVAESFPPYLNGVANTALRLIEHLKKDHELLVIAPRGISPRGIAKRTRRLPNRRLPNRATPLSFSPEATHILRDIPIVEVPARMVPPIDSLPISVPTFAAYRALKNFQPDIVHLASPYVLGGAAAFAAAHLGIPAVAVFQTDISGYTHRYHLSALEKASWAWTAAIHNRCARTLVPSTASMQALHNHGVENIFHWGRGVDTALFHPSNFDPHLRRSWDPQQKKFLVGYVGRLAAEKGVHRLRHLDEDPTIQVIIIGSGPLKDTLPEQLPNAIFMGELRGQELARAYASLDLFIHPGEYETFCQTVQEAHASGIPVIAPYAGGPIDLINPGITGDLLPLETFEDHLQVAAHRILKDPDLEEMKVECRRAVAHKTWGRYGEQVVEHYRAVLADHKRRSHPPMIPAAD